MKAAWIALCASMLVCSGVQAYSNTLAQSVDSTHSNETWTQSQNPFRIYGNTYYVGSRGLSAILIASPEGHVLINSTLSENVPMIEANIRALGFRVEDIKLILSSHTHFDHVGGTAALAHDSGAQVAASAKSAKALQLGGNDPDDPQYGTVQFYTKVNDVRIISDGQIVKVGSLHLQMHAMPGHMPGGTGWIWRSCEGQRCLSMVYADSVTLYSADGYRYNDPAHPERLADFRRTLTTLVKLPCDILIVPHPTSDFFDKAARIASGTSNPLIDTQACKAYAAEGQINLENRIRKEQGSQTAH